MKKKHFASLLKAFDFQTLFNELGWDNFDNTLHLVVKENVLTLRGIAEKKGYAVFLCESLSDGTIPPRQIRQQLETKAAKQYYEHLIIYTDLGSTRQIWQVAVKEENKPRQVREVIWHTHQDTEVLFQRLRNLFFTLDEEETISIVDVTQRMSKNFTSNTEKITKKFYAEFKKQHEIFLEFISGIDDKLKISENPNKQWYASLMLNRLMFCYFIQKKGFLDQDVHYLRNKLDLSMKGSGDDKFYSFYRSFLLELFHDGLGKPENQRHVELLIPLGKIPYLNGGLFDVHELERQFKKIRISDEAFQNIFDFFDNWNWHLDTRYETDGKDINPDVIGYIFEKYINDRASMGAYYTKEDITDYIGKNTIIPYLFDETQRNYEQPFLSGGDLWEFLKRSGDTYIYDAVKYGVPKDQDLFSDLPAEINFGFNLKFESQVVSDRLNPPLWENRKPWNREAPADIALPTETYREVIARRMRAEEVKSNIADGKINSVDDLIRYNLNIRQLIQDFLETTDDVIFIRHFYQALENITVLDPTVGSGAFLFAALNILEPLYEICLERMEQFVSEEQGRHQTFEEIIDRLNSDQHPNLRYFIFKSIILNNLYGVDIMKEAVEIAKLRLFLKLVATVDVNPQRENYGLEPLPDIDFNIKAGNTLVGYVSDGELLNSITQKEGIFSDRRLGEFKEDIQLVSEAFHEFQNRQLLPEREDHTLKKAKHELSEKLNYLNQKLNIYLATNYAKDPENHSAEYLAWLTSHQPFHWLAEFFSIINSGGFNIIIGNPPYVEYSKVRSEYTAPGYRVESSGNLYAFVLERGLNLLSKNGYLGFIVPHSLSATYRSKPLQDLMKTRMELTSSYYTRRPAKLFNGADQCLLILLGSLKANSTNHLSSTYQRWYTSERRILFQTMNYTATKLLPLHDRFRVFPKLGFEIEHGILDKLMTNKPLGLFLSTSGSDFYTHRIARYFIKATTFVPYFESERDGVKRSDDFKLYHANESIWISTIVAALNSSLFYWFWRVMYDGYHCGKENIASFPLELTNVLPEIRGRAGALTSDLMTSYRTNAERKKVNYKGSGTVKYDAFSVKHSKTILNEIDQLFAEHYGFSESELDFIINYDIKYRMGDSLN
jgi:hypothetical protein